MKNNLLYLSLLAFVLISTSALALSNNLDNLVTYIFPEKNVKAYSLLPILKDGAKYPILSAQSVMAIDLASGVTLYYQLLQLK